MSDDLKELVILTAPVRISWPQVIEPKVFSMPGKPPGEPQFSARFVFPAAHPDLLRFRTVATKLVKKVVPAGVDLKTLRPSQDFWWPFKSGETVVQEAKLRAVRLNREYGGYEDYMLGHQTLYAKSFANNPPQLDVWMNGQWIEVSDSDKVLHKNKFYNGMEAAGSVTFVAYSSALGWGVTAYLTSLGATGGGEHIGGRPKVTYGFDVPPLKDRLADHLRMQDDEISF